MPATLTEDGRRALSEIAARARTEHVHGYTVMCLGLQSHLVAARLAAAERAPPLPALDP